mgnify:CR=1 FL=1
MELVIREKVLRDKVYRGREVLRKRGILTIGGNGHADLEGLFGLMVYLVNGQLKIRKE